MARKLSQNTINKFKKRLEAEREQLLSMLEQHQEEREKVRLSEAVSYTHLTLPTTLVV